MSTLTRSMLERIIPRLSSNGLGVFFSFLNRSIAEAHVRDFHLLLDFILELYQSLPNQPNADLIITTIPTQTALVNKIVFKLAFVNNSLKFLKYFLEKGYDLLTFEFDGFHKTNLLQIYAAMEAIEEFTYLIDIYGLDINCMVKSTSYVQMINNFGDNQDIQEVQQVIPQALHPIITTIPPTQQNGQPFGQPTPAILQAVHNWIQQHPFPLPGQPIYAGPQPAAQPAPATQPVLPQVLAASTAPTAIPEAATLPAQHAEFPAVPFPAHSTQPPAPPMHVAFPTFPAPPVAPTAPVLTIPDTTIPPAAPIPTPQNVTMYATQPTDKHLVKIVNPQLMKFYLSKAPVCKEYALIASIHDVDCLEVLLDYDVDVNYQDESGLTALIYNGACGYEETVRRLLAHPSIQPEQTDQTRRSVLHLACQNGHISIVLMLLQQTKLTINQCDNLDMTPLMLACVEGRLDTVRAIFEYYQLYGSLHDIRINIQSNKGSTALHGAAIGGSLAVVKLLLEHPSIDILRKNKKGQIASEVAESFQHYDVASYLKQIEAKRQIIR